MLKATCAVLALFLLATQLPELSSAKNGLNSKKTLDRVLSIVSAVDLTLRYTHGKISVIESHVKQLKNGRISNYFSKLRGQINTLETQLESTLFLFL